jgi:hypothetical protein
MASKTTKGSSVERDVVGSPPFLPITTPALRANFPLRPSVTSTVGSRAQRLRRAHNGTHGYGKLESDFLPAMDEA